MHGWRTGRRLLVSCWLLAGCRESPAVVHQSLEAKSSDSAAELGRYLVDHLYACGDCHTPRLPSGDPDASRYLAGVECLFDVDPAQGRGCMHTKNLTNHARGLANVTDDGAIQHMFLEGRRPDGKFLHPAMPAYALHTMPAEHADAIVAHLRRVPGVDHLVPPSEPPFDVPPAIATRPLELAALPEVPASTPDAASARRGRALAAGACVACHTPPLPNPPPGALPLDTTRLFAGGRRFLAARIGVPSPPFPDAIYSHNLTQHATGLRGVGADAIVRVLKLGKDEKGQGVCPPMPVGPRGAFGGLRDDDARDIARYILTLPGIENSVPAPCAAEAP